MNNKKSIAQPFIPLCISLGPLFILIGMWYFAWHPWLSSLGAIMLSVGCGCMFRKINILEIKLSSLER